MRVTLLILRKKCINLLAFEPKEAVGVEIDAILLPDTQISRCAIPFI